MNDKMRAWLCSLVDVETEQEWCNSEYVFFGTDEDIEKHELEESRFYTNREERETQLWTSEIDDESIARELWKFTKHHDSVWRPGGIVPARIKWLSRNCDIYDVERAIRKKYGDEVVVTDEYCERLLPLIQKHYMEVYP